MMDGLWRAHARKVSGDGLNVEYRTVGPTNYARASDLLCQWRAEGYIGALVRVDRESGDES